MEKCQTETHDINDDLKKWKQKKVQNRDWQREI